MSGSSGGGSPLDHGPLTPDAYPVTALPPLIKALLCPSIYPHSVDRVQLIQTHISYVLLAGDHVYKVKKPVSFGFLDFSSLGKRRYYCGQEALLNSRLCPDTYLGVIPIREREGRYSLGGAGRTAEYAVHMRRLPEDRMMHRLAEAGQVTPEMTGRLARRLAAFHEEAEGGPRITRYGDWAIRYAWDENFRQWERFIGITVTEEQDRILKAFGQAFFARKREVLARRREERRIRDCHGDLRSDSVCFLDDGRICIYDCIDFNRRFRYTDVAGDVGFLAMDLDYRGRPDLASAFVESYVKASGDADLTAIIGFYKCYRAAVRGKVEGFLLDQPEVPSAEKRRARQAAARYFSLAAEYAASLPPAMLVITCGLAGTGKSTLARALADATGFEVVSSDVVRKRLAGIEPGERRLEEFGAGIYAADFSELTYSALLDIARESLQAGRSVVIDASFIRREHRRRAADVARETGAQFACVEVQCEPEAVRARLERRLREGADPSDARWETYVRQRRRFQRPSEVPPERRIIVDASRPIRSQVRPVVTALRKISPLSVP
jgi:aminoglycoside phosphotransferase family enzyme/predicted kinase